LLVFEKGELLLKDEITMYDYLSAEEKKMVDGLEFEDPGIAELIIGEKPEKYRVDPAN